MLDKKRKERFEQESEEAVGPGKKNGSLINVGLNKKIFIVLDT